MSDNPNSGSELLSLGVDVDQSSFSALDTNLAGIRERLEELQQASFGVFEGTAGYDFAKALEAVREASFASDANLKTLTEDVRELSSEYSKLAQVATDAKNQALFGNMDVSQGYGVPGGAIGPAEAEPEAGTSIGSAFALGHGLSVAGHAFGSPALREAGGFVYIEEGIRKTLPLFEQLSEKITDNAGALTPFIAGLTELGVPFAGLLAVAVPVGVAIGAAAVVLKTFIDRIHEIQAAVDAGIAAQVKYNEETSKLTSDEAQAKIAEEKNTQQARINTIASAKAEIARLLGVSIDQVEGAVSTGTVEERKRNVAGLASGGVSTTDVERAQDLAAAIQKLQGEAAEAGANVNTLTLAMNQGAFATNDAAQAALKYADGNVQRAQMLAADDNMTSEAARKKVGMLQSERDAIMASLDALRPYVDTNADAKKKFEELSAQLSADSVEIEHLTQVSIPLAETREREKKAAEELQKVIGEVAKQTEAALKTLSEAPQKLFDAIQKAQEQFNNQVANARLREQQQEAQYQPGSMEDIHARSEIALREARDEVRAAQDAADKIVDIRRQLGNKEADLATDYQRSIFDDETRYQQDKAKLELNFQRQSQEDAISHVQKIHDINRRAFYDDQEALLDRNFLQLAKNALSRQRSIDEENTSYARRQADLQRHLAQQEQDLIISLVQREQQDRLSYERKLADAQRAAEREIQQAEIAENRKIAMLRQKEVQEQADLTRSEQYKIQILQRNLANEIHLYQQQEEQRIKIAVETEKVIVAKAIELLTKLAQTNFAGFLAGLFGAGNNIPGHAGGGGFEAGSPFEMSESGVESLSFGTGGGYVIPGRAMVMPLQSGTVDRNGGTSKSISIAPGAFPITISGVSDPERAAHLAVSEMYDKLQGIFQE